MPIALRRHSFKNHYLEIAKNESLTSFVINAPYLIAWEVMRLGYALARDREILPAYADAIRVWGRIWRKRQLLRARIRSRSSSPVAPSRG